MLIGKCNTEHGARQHGGDGALQLDRFFRSRHYENSGGWRSQLGARTALSKSVAVPAERTVGALGPWTRFAHANGAAV